MQIKIILRNHITPAGMTKDVGNEVDKRESFCTVGRNVNWYNHYGK